MTLLDDLERAAWHADDGDDKALAARLRAAAARLREEMERADDQGCLPALEALETVNAGPVAPTPARDEPAPSTGPAIEPTWTAEEIARGKALADTFKDVLAPPASPDLVCARCMGSGTKTYRAGTVSYNRVKTACPACNGTGHVHPTNQGSR